MTYQQPLGAQPTGWVGWILFAACIMVVSGMFSILEGLAGIFRDETFFISNGEVLVFNYRAWGWIHLLIGIGLVIVGIALYRGSTVARVAAIVLVGLNLLAQFTWIGAHPWWSVIIITLDVLIIYALVVHGEEMSTDT
jgi:hypothetical protein